MNPVYDQIGTWQDIMATSQFKVSPVPLSSGTGLELWNEIKGPERKNSMILTCKRELSLCKQEQMKCIYPLLKAVFKITTLVQSCLTASSLMLLRLILLFVNLIT